MYVLRFDLYEGMELRMPPARGLEKLEVEIVWGHQKVCVLLRNAGHSLAGSPKCRFNARHMVFYGSSLRLAPLAG